MQGGKKDHFVPQGYLRRFATDESKLNLKREDWKVYTVNRKAPKLPAQARRIDSVAYSNYFEQYKADEFVNDEIRLKINQLENLFFAVQERLIQIEDLTKLALEDLKCLVLYSAFQKERSLARRQFYKRQLESAARSFDEEAQEFTGIHKMIAEGAVEGLVQSLKAELEKTVMQGTVEEITAYFEKLNTDISALNLAGLDEPSERRAVVEACSKVFEERIWDAFKNLPMSVVAQEVSDMAASKEKLRDYHLEKIFEFAVALAEDLANCAWVLHKNLTATPFWTSDNPVSCFTRPSKEEDERVDVLVKTLKTMASVVEPASLRGPDGKINVNFELLFPISPTLLLWVGKFEEGKGMRMSKVEVDTEDVIAAFNYRQYVGTSTNLYSNRPEFAKFSGMPRQTRQILDAAREDWNAMPKRIEALIKARAGEV